MPTPQDRHQSSAAYGAPAERTFVECRFLAPRAWRDDFKDAARARAVSMSDLHRQLMRDFLRSSHELENAANLASAAHS